MRLEVEKRYKEFQATKRKTNKNSILRALCLQILESKSVYYV